MYWFSHYFMSFYFSFFHFDAFLYCSFSCFFLQPMGLRSEHGFQFNEKFFSTRAQVEKKTTNQQERFIPLVSVVFGRWLAWFFSNPDTLTQGLVTTALKFTVTDKANLATQMHESKIILDLVDQVSRKSNGFSSMFLRFCFCVCVSVFFSLNVVFFF